MAEKSPVFLVTVGPAKIEIDTLKPKTARYEKAHEEEILRERDAIELFQKMSAEGSSGEGSYSFHSLETAKTFAMLYLKKRMEKLEDNLDDIQGYGAA
jgi:hypothetical protein